MHYSLLVRCPSSLTEPELSDHVHQAMEPFAEAGSRDDPEWARKYCRFVDETAAVEEGWAGTEEMVQLVDGSRASPYDERFQSGTALDRKYEYPADSSRVQVPVSELYASKALYAREYHGYEEDPAQPGRFGHHSNPEGHWDWWVIGGRWAGRILRVRPLPAVQSVLQEGGLPVVLRVGASEPKRQRRSSVDPEERLSTTQVDGARIRDLDWDWYAAETERLVAEFWGELPRFLAGEEFEPYEGLTRMGWLECCQDAEVPDSAAWVRSWGPGRGRSDFMRAVPTPTAENQACLRALLSPLRPYAYLGLEGRWELLGKYHGEDAPPTTADFLGEFLKAVRSGDDGDWLVTVDIHS